MNIIEDGIARLENGWCKSQLQDGDKFCAIGAVMRSQYAANVNMEVDKDISPYEDFKSHPAAKAMAKAVLEDEDYFQSGEWKECVQSMYDDGVYDEIVYTFNDDQETVEPVLEMFRRANKIYTQELHAD